MELKLRENKGKEHQWYFEYWIEVDGKRQHRTQVIGPASGPDKLSRKSASELLRKASIEISAARAAARSTGLTEFTTMTDAAAMWFERKESDGQAP